MKDNGMLTFFCGKMGAGKSTKAKEISDKNKSILISEDEWLAALYPSLIVSVSDYSHYSNLLKPQIKTLTQSILKCGQDVVLDFPGNTISQRQWLKAISEEIDAPHRMYFINHPNERCLNRVLKRAVEQPQRHQTDTEEMFYAMEKYFEIPTTEEKINIEEIN